MFYQGITASALLFSAIFSSTILAEQPVPTTEVQEWFVASDGDVVLRFDEDAIRTTGYGLVSSDWARGDALSLSYTVDTNAAMYEIIVTNRQLAALIGGDLPAVGQTFRFADKAGRGVVVQSVYIVHDPSGASATEFTVYDGADFGLHLFDLSAAAIEFDDTRNVVTLQGDMRISDDLANLLGSPKSAGLDIGELTATLTMQLSQTLVLDQIDGIQSATMHAIIEPGTEGPFPSPGPDVIVGDLPETRQYGRTGVIGSGTVGLSVGTTSCNKGDTPFNWFALPATDHPMIPMNMYRLKTVGGAEQFEQIGQSWMKHGFTALQQNICGFGCNATAGTTLGVGCSDPYSVGLNSSQCGLGVRAQLNPYTGVTVGGGNLGGSPCGSSNYPARDHRGHTHDGIAHRLQVPDADLANPGARYFSEGQYLTPHEFNDTNAFNNQNMNNNASHREVSVTGPDGSGTFTFGNVSATVRESPAIDAWTGATQVLIEPAPMVDGRAFLSYKVTDLGGGTWHYEYAVYNMNMDRSIDSFSVPVHSSVTVTNAAFHFPLNHSDPGVSPSEEYANTNWVFTNSGSALSWSTDNFATDPNANAIRFGTLYNFRFDADSGPQSISATLGLFKTATTTTAATQGPMPVGPPPVCGNSIVEAGEQCDDGNTTNGDGCDQFCQFETTCGNNIVEFGEQCDDGNTINTDSCVGNCLNATCGDGFVWAGVEECDDAGQSAACDADCTFAVCGDGTLNTLAGEACDDGNTTPGDGCDALCQIESNDLCADAIAISEGATSYDTTGANTDGQAHAVCEFDGQTYNDIWYEYTPNCTGNLTVSLCGSGYDTDLVIYDGCVCPLTDIELLACNDDNCGGSYRSELPSASYPTIAVTAGNCYKIRVGGWNTGDAGTGTITITNDASPCFPPCTGTGACDDGDPCTSNDTCTNNMCIGGPPPPCTDDTCTDCNVNGITDQCEGLQDCNLDGVPDQCQAGDCNTNGINDICDIVAGTSVDCDGGPIGVIADGATIFAGLCMFCHGPDGSGGVGPDIRNHSRVLIWNQLLPPTTHSGGAHPEFGIQGYADIEAFLASAGSLGRPDLTPDECQVLTDCDIDGTTDACELDAGTQVDLDYDGIPDDCQCTDPCTDGDACTTGDACSGGTCVGGPPLNCDDTNVCTTDSCDSVAGCVNTPIVCDDGNACTTDTCDALAGCVFTPIDCNDGSACTADSCDTVTGCANVPISCDDTNACTADSCDTVTGCVNAPIVCDDSSACTTDTCDTVAGCVFTPVVCDDTDVCTTDTCNVTTGCIFSAVDCNDTNACTADSCDTVTGCVNAAITCDDASACTTDTCDTVAGCVFTPVVCDDTDACTTDTCNVTTGCVFSAIDCNDTNACTADSCDTVTGCANVPITCDDASACTTDTCDTVTGCVFTPVVCDDTDACTTDTCNVTTGCVFSAIDCNDTNVCTADSCDTVTGCVNAPIVCDDSSACTADTCDTVTGCVFTPVVCDDTNACTTDSCDVASGCVFNAVDCDDGNLCTIDACDIAAGCTNTPVSCPGGEVCDPADGLCSVCVTDGDCDDGVFCNGIETCVGGSFCAVGTDPCDDGIDCTSDQCNEATDSCVPVPFDFLCDNGLFCDGVETCDVLLGCQAGTSVVCDDSDLCTADSCDDVAGECVNLDISADCDDGDPCTDNTCVPTAGCVTTNNTAPCDDGDACTSGDACALGTCAGAPVICDDGNACTIDSCDSAIGCVTACAPFGVSCDMGGGPDSGKCDGACVCEPAGTSCPTGTAADCCDLDFDSVRDDSCVWCACDAGICANLDVPYGDLGGAFGDCIPDGFCNLADALHALTCFSDTSGCDEMNIDVGGAFGDCAPDGFCNLADALHALTCFASTNPCTCGTPAPEFGPIIVDNATLTLVAGRRAARPGDVIDVRVFIDNALTDLQSYQLHVAAGGGRQGHLELLGVTVEARRDFVFGGVDGVFSATNAVKSQMLAGNYAGNVMTPENGYLATFTYYVSPDARGMFVVDVLHDGTGDQTYMVASFVNKVEIVATNPAVIVVSGGKSSSVR